MIKIVGKHVDEMWINKSNFYIVDNSKIIHLIFDSYSHGYPL